MKDYLDSVQLAIDEINNNIKECEYANRKARIGDIAEDDEINKQVESLYSLLPFFLKMCVHANLVTHLIQRK